MIDRKVFFGMKQDKFLAKNPAVTPTDSGFDFRRTYTEKIQTGPVVEIIYYFTTTENAVLYEFIIKYRDMQSVQATATQLLGIPNHKNTEWRISNKEIKEDFNIGVWTFGHKIVYAATLEGCEWEKGFES
ncbi:hypothetical protein G5B37_04780 [Rasiella rasia]|uniref:Uncharacterized protein n=1 Tax=Rasiella rasia TaxID=2744027 RepID=A0A6G6GMH8_9FLAO|nr:hypothetical protein [Rasiella rasia]QIE58901.1 hypothetical protein G5B37_04780 [Rasiella rasia]